MTTISYLGGILAFDGRSSRDTHVVTNNCIKGIVTDEYLVGVCGDHSVGEEFLHWAKAGFGPNKPKFEPGAEFVGIAINRKGIITEYEANMIPAKIGKKPFYAIGSGAAHALGAMEAGADAIQAVRIAAKYDVYTGGRIRAVRFND